MTLGEALAEAILVYIVIFLVILSVYIAIIIFLLKYKWPKRETRIIARGVAIALIVLGIGLLANIALKFKGDNPDRQLRETIQNRLEQKKAQLDALSFPLYTLRTNPPRANYVTAEPIIKQDSSYMLLAYKESAGAYDNEVFLYQYQPGSKVHTLIELDFGSCYENETQVLKPACIPVRSVPRFGTLYKVSSSSQKEVKYFFGDQQTNLFLGINKDLAGDNPDDMAVKLIESLEKTDKTNLPVRPY